MGRKASQKQQAYELNGAESFSVRWRARSARAALQDPLSELDAGYALCRRTGLSYSRVLSLMAVAGGDMDRTIEALGYSPRNRSKFRGMDGGWWNTIRRWILMYVPAWEAEFRRATLSSDITQMPDPESALQNVARALGIPVDTLLHYSEHRDEINAFLETQRPMLGQMAEMRLWQLIAQGDAPTVRWALPRLMPEHYADRAAEQEPGNERKIRIIDAS